ncbi:MAG: hypothetical protein KAI64_06835, partial [Thermoplasmata archaeon]|nr:hypothetical protein [Thermoplasmata archaeon]
DTDEALREHRNESGINFENWTIARDAVQANGAYVKQMYNVYELVTIYIIDRDGWATYNKVGGISTEEFQKEIEKAMLGAPAIAVQQLSMVVLAVLAGIASFFSPCAFPMLPGYMAYFLGLQTSHKEKSTKKVYRRAVLGGIAGGIGIISVYMIIGVIIISFGTAVSGYIPLMGPIVGIILILLGLLMLTNLEYSKIVKPFQVLYAKLFRRKKDKGETAKKEGEEKGDEEKDESKGFYSKLFRYGVGYGAAASACVAPLFIVLVMSASTASMTGTFLDGLIVLLLYAFVVIGLMVAITIALTVFGQKATQKMSKYTELIKKVSAVVLIIVGVYLVYYYYTAFLA